MCKSIYIRNYKEEIRNCKLYKMNTNCITTYLSEDSTLQSAFSDSFEMQFVFYLLQIMNTNKNTQQVE